MNWADIEDDPEPQPRVETGGVNWADISEEDDAPLPGYGRPRPGLGKTRDPLDATKLLEAYYGTNAEGKSIKITNIYKEKRKKVLTNKYIDVRKKAWNQAMFGRCRDATWQQEFGHNTPNAGEQHVTLEVNKDKLLKATGAEEKFWENSITVVEQLMAEGRKKKYDANAAAAERQKMMDDSIQGGNEKGGKSGAMERDGGGKGDTRSYVPPGMRDGKDGPSNAKGDGKGDKSNQQELTLRVTNLSEDTREGDVQKLFQLIGQLPLRVFLPKYKDEQVQHDPTKSGQHKGFAFVSLKTKADCETAIRKLNGHGYDNLILGVQWAAPRKEN